MEHATLRAVNRATKGSSKDPKFINGIIYSHDMGSTSVKFHERDVRMALASDDPKSTVWVQQEGGDKKLGFIKEIQRHITKRHIIHIDVHLVE